MNQPLRSRLKVAASAFASNAVNGNLRRAQLSYFAAWTAEWAFTVALGIVAYRDGGATAVGLVGLLRTIRGVATAVGRHRRRGLAHGRDGRCLCLTLDRSDKRARGNGRHRCALSDPGGGDMASPGASRPRYRRTRQRDWAAPRHTHASAVAAAGHRTSRAVWNRSMCPPARRYFTRVIQPG